MSSAAARTEAGGWRRVCHSWRPPAPHALSLSAVSTLRDPEPAWVLGDEDGSHASSQTPCPFRTNGSLLWPQGFIAAVSHPCALGCSSQHTGACLKGGPPRTVDLAWPGPSVPKIKIIPGLNPRASVEQQDSCFFPSKNLVEVETAILTTLRLHCPPDRGAEGSRWPRGSRPQR